MEGSPDERIANAANYRFLPRNAGEGDHAKRGGGGGRLLDIVHDVRQVLVAQHFGSCNSQNIDASGRKPLIAALVVLVLLLVVV